MEEKHSQAEVKEKNSRKPPKIRRERELRGWSQLDLAKKLGTEPRSVRRWEQGENLPNPYMRERLLELFSMNAQELGLINEEEEEICQKSQPSDTTTPSMANIPNKEQTTEEQITNNTRLYLTITTSILFFISITGCMVVFYITRNLIPLIVPILVAVPMFKVIAYYFPSRRA